MGGPLSSPRSTGRGVPYPVSGPVGGGGHYPVPGLLGALSGARSGGGSPYLVPGLVGGGPLLSSPELHGMPPPPVDRHTK